MATGYTATIKDGISFNEFILGCARAFGACIEMRDEPHDKPIPDAFEPSPYHLEQTVRGKGRLHCLCKMSLDLAKESEEAEYFTAIDDANKQIKIAKETEKSYKAMLKSVNEWTPPTDEHKGLKEFMIQQIEDSIKHDCDTSFYTERTERLPRLSPEDWKQKQINACKDDIEYHEKHFAEDVECAEGRSEWVSKLRSSIE